MRSVKKLSFKNIRVNKDSVFLEKQIKISVVENEDIFAEARCYIYTIKDFVSEWFYFKVLFPEMNYFFEDVCDMCNDKEKIMDMSLKEYIEYINSKYESDKTFVLNELYGKYGRLKKYISLDKSIDNECVYVENIYSGYKDKESEALILEYLKENYDTVCISQEIEKCWAEIDDFKSIANGFMYWTKSRKLDEIF